MNTSWFSIPLSVFAGAAVPFIEKQVLLNGTLELPTTAKEWGVIAIGAIGAGLFAVWHKYQPSPSQQAIIERQASVIRSMNNPPISEKQV